MLYNSLPLIIAALTGENISLSSLSVTLKLRLLTNTVLGSGGPSVAIFTVSTGFWGSTLDTAWSPLALGTTICVCVCVCVCVCACACMCVSVCVGQTKL